MKCVNCGKEISPDKNFCSSCGVPVAKRCPNCNSICEMNDVFCGACGTNLADQPTNIRYPTKIEKSGFESSRKHITVLFADIKGSTSLIEKQDPEETRNLIGPAIQEMISAVYRFDGTIIHTAGDGITAIFGAPQPLEDHALRACFAALSMQAKIRSINEAIKIRVGINSGEVLLEILGDARHLEYDVVGSAVNLAARMEQTAEPDSIQITKETLNLVTNSVDVTSIGQIQVKGFRDPIDTFKLNSITEAKSHFNLESRNTSPFIGREKELTELKQLLTQVKSGEGRVASLIGEAGLGKSRLVYELIHSKEASNFKVITVGAFSHTFNVNLFPIIKLFREIFVIKNDENPERLKEKIMPYLKSIEQPHAFSAILELLQMPNKDDTWTELDPPLKRRSMFEVGVQVILNIAANQPLILLIEDLHWVDSETEAFLDSLVTNMKNAAILLLLTYRPEYQSLWLKSTNNTAIALNIISKSDAEKILDSILGNDFSLIDLKMKILNEYGGNPFFLEEMVKNFVNENILIGSPGIYQLNTAQLISSLKLPETIFAVLQTQIDKLPLKQKKILQVSSVIGQRFNYNLLEQVMEVDQKELRESINQLQNSMYIYETQTYPETEFSFKHALIQEVSYNSLLKASRHLMHLKLLSILEKHITQDSSINDLQLLANHAFLAEEWEKAFYYCKIVGEKLTEISSLKLAVQLFERALIAASHLPASKELMDQRIDIYTDMTHLLTRLGRFLEQASYLDEAMKLAVSQKNEFVESILYSLKAHHMLCIGKTQGSAEFTKKADELADKIKIPDAKLTSLFFIIYQHIFLGQYKEANEVGEKFFSALPNTDYAPSFNKMPYYYLINFYLIWANSYAGNFDFIESRKDAWIKLQNLDQASFKAYLILGSIGLYYYFRGEFEEATNHLSKALNYAIQLETIIVIPAYASALGCCYFYLGRKKQAKELIYQGLNTDKIIKFSFVGAFSIGSICEGLMLLGENEEAKIIINEGIAIIEERQLWGQRPWLLRLSAENDLQLPNPNYVDIKTQLENALKTAENLSLPVQIAHCHFALAKLYNKMRQKEPADKELQRALTYYQKLDMPYWCMQCQPFMID